MNVLVCGAAGCVGNVAVRALRWRGHSVIAAARSLRAAVDALPLDFMQARLPGEWATALRERRGDAVVNCVGILMLSATTSFARVHGAGPIELFRGAALAGIGRVVQVSALGVGDTASTGETDYLRSKRLADQALLALDVDAAIVRPSMSSKSPRRLPAWSSAAARRGACTNSAARTRSITVRCSRVTAPRRAGLRRGPVDADADGPDACRRAAGGVGAATRLQPRHSASSRTRQRPYAQCRNGVAGPSTGRCSAACSCCGWPTRRASQSSGRPLRRRCWRPAARWSR